MNNMKKSNYTVTNGNTCTTYKSLKWAFKKFLTIYKTRNYKNLKLTQNNKILIEIL